MAFENPFIPNVSERIQSIENNGVWERGGSYEILWTSYYWVIEPSQAENFITYSYRLAPMVDTANDDLVPDIDNIIFSSESVANDYNLTFPVTSIFRNFLFIDFTDYTSLAMNTDILHSWVRGVDEGGEFPHPWGGRSFFFKHQWVSTFTVPEDAELGTFILAYEGYSNDAEPNPNVHTEKQRVYYDITIVTQGGSAPAPYPESRPESYDPDDEWDPNSDGNLLNPGDPGYIEPGNPGFPASAGDWTSNPWDLATLGGGSYNQQLVVLGHRKIYFQELT